MRRGLLLLALPLLCPPAGRLHAQAADALPQGTRVRVTAPSVAERRLTGRVVSADADTLRILHGEAPVAIPRGAVERVEVSRGRSRLWGAVVGAGAGAVGGGAVGFVGCYAMGDECTHAEEGPLLLVVMGSMMGAPVGGVVGLVRGRERWRSLPLASPQSFTVVPRGDGVALSVSFAL